MGLNLERTQALLRSLADADPDSEARQQLIPVSAEEGRVRLRAIALITADLLREPSVLMPDDPPRWLLELSPETRNGRAILFDGRLTELATRVVDDLQAQGCTADELVQWLDDLHRERDRTAPHPDPPRRVGGGSAEGRTWSGGGRVRSGRVRP